MTTATHSASDLILWDVVEEHFEEAVFLFEKWEQALYSPRYNLTELGATLERRLEAHLDGLLVGGRDVAVRILDPELTNVDEPARATVAALALLFDKEAETAKRVIDTALHADGPLQRALTRALTLANVETLDQVLLDIFRAKGPEPGKAILLEVLTGRSVDVGYLLSSYSQSVDERLVGAVLDAASRFCRREMIAFAEGHLRSDHPRLRASALKASLALGSREAWYRCRQLAQEPNIDDFDALLLTAILGQPGDHQILYQHLENSARVEWILWVLGFCGTVQAGDACLAHLESKDERVAKAAAEAMSWIGGFDLNEKQFQAPRAEPGEDETLPSLADDDLDADLGMDGLDDLPVPNRETIAKWWKENCGGMGQNQRHVLGRPYSPESVVHALEAGSLWRRHGVALELAIRSNGEQHVSTDVFSSRQRREMAAVVKA